jgi:glycosyltransferase involved in cell wall biosynthesis
MNKSLSVCFISFNEEKNIKRTLDKIKDIADEIIIVDNGSTDKTVEIAKSFGAKVYTQEWKGFVKQKNSALEKCQYNWILSLDCDEVLTDELIKEIKKAINSNKYSGYYLKRKTYLFNKFLNYAWTPDKKLRLVKKENDPKWIGDTVHEELKVSGKTSILKGYLEHYSYKDIEDHLFRTIKYSKIAAIGNFQKKKKFSILSLIFNAPIKFFKEYIVKLGFLDGIHGLYAAFGALIYTYFKYFFLWELYENSKKNDL